MSLLVLVFPRGGLDLVVVLSSMGLSLTYATALTTYFSYALLFVMGHVRDTWRKVTHALTGRGWRAVVSPAFRGLAPMLEEADDFYTRRLFLRIQDCFNRPIASAPDR